MKHNDEKVNEKTRKIAIIAMGLSVVLLVFVLYFATRGTDGSEYIELANCLTENDVKMYGTFWCSHCSNQKRMFGVAFQNIDYIECDERGAGGNATRCMDRGIKGYPTWEINSTLYSGVHKLEDLAALSGCESALGGQDE